MLTAVEIVLALPIVALTLGSTLGLLTNSHWFFRGWEYPRLQIAALPVLLCGLFAGVDLIFDDAWQWWDTALVVAASLVVGWHLVRVFPFLPIAKNQVLHDHRDMGGRGIRVRVLTSNVQMENTDYDRFIAMVRERNPDVVVVLETDGKWAEGLQPLFDEFKHFVSVPQENWYGMVMLTNCELVEHEVRFIVQEDIPSIHARMKLPSGGPDAEEFVLHCLHPRPPEPIRGTHATSRDAELVVVGREIETADEPTIVTGDLNDVAWSHTTRLFLRLSALLDPRRGRGLFTTWPVDHPFWRVPLDHVFHSEDFTFGDLQRCEDIGSDHFPICADLVWRRTAEDLQEPDPTFGNDEEEAQAKIDEAEEVNAREVRSPERTQPQVIL